MHRFAKNKLQVTLFHKLMAFAAFLQSIPARVTPPPFRLIQIGSAFWQSRALYVAARLSIADALGDDAQSTTQLAQALELNEDRLYRLLRMLASLGIFQETSPRVFRNSAASHYLRADKPRNVRAMILMHNSPEMTRPWTEALEDGIRTGRIPFRQVHGADLFDYMSRHQEFDLLFAEAMDSVETVTGDQYLQDFDWSRFERIIDVGGSKGRKALSILAAHPNLKAVVFDRPQVIEAAKSSWQGKVSDDVLGRVEFRPGDMLESVPQARSDRDLYLFVAVFHGVGDADGERVLHNLRTAFGDNRPHLLIVDTVAAETGIDPTTAAFDMQMLIGTEGRERTLSEWQSLLARGGFQIVETVSVRTFAKFIVARARP